MSQPCCPDCGEQIAGDSDTCQACCDHEYDPDEGFTCLNCGHDGMEQVLSDAYDRKKGSRYE